MKLLIDIPEEFYEAVKRDPSILAPPFLSCEKVGKIIANGTPLPKGHGELKDINAIRQKLMIWDYKVNAIPNYAWKCIEDAPTIIGADKEG